MWMESGIAISVKCSGEISLLRLFLSRDLTERGDYDDICKGEDSHSKWTVRVMPERMTKFCILGTRKRSSILVWWRLVRDKAERLWK